LQGNRDPEKQAELSWKVLSAMVTGPMVGKLGFQSLGSNIVFLSPVEQFDVSLSSLRSWNREQLPDKLLEHSPVLLVPVQVADHMRSSIRLRREGELWRLSAFGSPQFTAAWEKARRAGGEFIVFVEGLELAFAGKRDKGNGLYLLPMT